ncbi:MAG: ATP-binding cassette domain-containing protein, partial [Bifidobacteriaceae bacterium]|nr:ATP-binding cassette domain-containing protein [Bifidobacteriaceae bacterium]
RILDHISCSIHSGEAVGLLGANGSGKSTLVKALLGLIPIGSGQVQLFGQTPGRRVPWGRVAYVPQDSPAGAGVPTSALEVVMAGTLTGWRPWLPRDAKPRALAALDQVGLADRARDRLKDFSGGQRHRVLLARALVRQPELLIMDEPLAGVDDSSAELLVDALRRRTDLTTLVVLHQPGPFADYLTRGLQLDQGRLVAEGTLAELAPGLPQHHHHDAPTPRRSQTPQLDFPLPRTASASEVTSA